MTQTPLTAVLTAQRTAIEQSQAMTHDVIEAQKTSFSALADALTTSEQLVEQNADLTRSMLHAYVDAVEATMPEESADFEDLRSLVDESFETATEAQLESLESLVRTVEESETAYSEFSDGYVDVVDSSFDAYLEAHEQVGQSVEEVAANVQEASDEFDVAA
ncbi:hypothetical protein [Natronobiforma cellulositropha]|uniref:hypothetical protein n=1 Tax=Natronobiforma cellulositropha TaxID=1679076 RepID=UPI0021D6019B|nr:hypothetical protein [Natronobiforma cellulositropha]